jgi:hypothetical protein
LQKAVAVSPRWESVAVVAVAAVVPGAAQVPLELEDQVSPPVSIQTL